MRASEAVRDDFVVAGGRQTCFFCCCSSSCSGGRTSRDVPSIKTIKGDLLITKKNRFSVEFCQRKKFVTLPCIVSSWSDFRPGRLAEVVCDVPRDVPRDVARDAACGGSWVVPCKKNPPAALRCDTDVMLM